MQKYNIYYGYNKINNKPLTNDDINIILSKNYIYKNIDGKNIKINTSSIKILKCTVL